MRHNLVIMLLLLVGLLFNTSCYSVNTHTKEERKGQTASLKKSTRVIDKQFRGIVFAPQGVKNANDFVKNFEKMAENSLVPLGINAVIFDMHWNNFHFTSEKNLDHIARNPDLEFTKKHAAALSHICKENNLDVIVGMNILTHQNYGQFLKAFPNLSWPGLNNLWDPLNPKVNRIAFKMIDELIESFSPIAFHIGMDEGYDFDASKLPSNRTQQLSNDQLFAKVVNDYYEHIVGQHNLEMMMWSDMIEGRHGIVSLKNTLDLINKNVIMVSWNYVSRDEYPWPGILMEHGFRVIVAPHKDPLAAKKFLNAAIREDNQKLTGVLYTTWSSNVATDLRYALTDKKGHPKALDVNMLGVAETIKETISLFR